MSSICICILDINRCRTISTAHAVFSDDHLDGHPWSSWTIFCSSVQWLSQVNKYSNITVTTLPPHKPPDPQHFMLQMNIETNIIAFSWNMNSLCMEFYSNLAVNSVFVTWLSLTPFTLVQCPPASMRWLR